MVPELKESRCHTLADDGRSFRWFGRAHAHAIIHLDLSLRDAHRPLDLLDLSLRDAHRPLDLLDPFNCNTNNSYIFHSASSAKIQGSSVPTRRLHSNSKRASFSDVGLFLNCLVLQLEGKRICFFCLKARVIVLAARIGTRGNMEAV